MMRVAHIYSRTDFMNPTKMTFVSEMASRAGVVSVNVECLGHVAIAVEAARISDIVLVDGRFFFSRWSRRADPLTVLADALEHTGKPIVLIGLMDDPHGGLKEEYEELRKSGYFYLNIATSIQFYRSVDWSKPEGWMSRSAPYFEGSSILNERYTLLPHSLSEEEFATDVSLNGDIFSILGVQYRSRRQAAASLRLSGLNVVTGDDFVFRVMRMIVGRTGMLKSQYRRAFQRVLRNSFASFTCDAGIGYPIRKFFEIPAAGVPLIGSFFRSPESLGFRPGVNCLSAETPEEVEASARLLLQNQALRLELASAGLRMVRNYHHVSIRVSQVLDFLSEVAAGRLMSTFWRDGRLVLLSVEGREQVI